jgi:predicted outer membrane protein
MSYARTMFVNRAASIVCLGLVMATAVRAADQFPADTEFVRMAEQTGEQAIVDARFALNMSHNAGVKDAARLLQNDGIAANRKLMALAVEKGWPAPALNTADPVLDYSDYHFVSRQIRVQQKAIALYKEEAANGADTELQEFARDALPALQRGLISLRSLRSS